MSLARTFILCGSFGSRIQLVKGPAVIPHARWKGVARTTHKLKPAAGVNLMSEQGKAVRVVVVGDVHGHFHLAADEKALQFLQPDLVLFVGDFGEEDVELVADVSQVSLPKAVVLGNHDAWYCYADFDTEGGTDEHNQVQQQIDILGDCHVGYGRKDFPYLKLSVVGGRPFSWGGSIWKRASMGLPPRYGVHSFDESAQKIFEAAMGAPQDHALIFLAHNGPFGYGEEPDDICGRDFPDGGKKLSKDHGDPDLQVAMQKSLSSGRKVSAAVFGHMHHRLYGHRGKDSGGYRKMFVKDKSSGVGLINGAVVPRVRAAPSSDNGNGWPDWRHFTIFELLEGALRDVRDVWVEVGDREVKIAKEEVRRYAE